MKRIIINLVKVLLVSSIFYYLVSNGRLNFEYLKLFWEYPFVLFTTLGTLIFVIIPLVALRWWLLLKAIGLKVHIARVHMLTWIGNFFNLTLPGAVSGDFVKGYYIIQGQEKSGRTLALSTLLIDRLSGLFGLIVMAFFALVFNFEFVQKNETFTPLAMVISGLFLGTIIFYIIVLFPFEKSKDPFIFLFDKLPGRNLIIKIYLAFKSYQHHRVTLLITLLISISIHSIIAILFFQISVMVGITNLDIATQFFIMPIGLITIAIPLAPGGVGVGHAAFDQLYQLVGVSGGADIFNLFIILQLSVFLLGGIPYLFYSNEYKVPKSEELESL